MTRTLFPKVLVPLIVAATLAGCSQPPPAAAPATPPEAAAAADTLATGGTDVFAFRIGAKARDMASGPK